MLAGVPKVEIEGDQGKRKQIVTKKLNQLHNNIVKNRL